MKLPRGVPANRLIRVLERLGYKVIRQRGSHVRLRHEGPPAHTITVPLHNPLKTGTFMASSPRWRRPGRSLSTPSWNCSEISVGNESVVLNTPTQQAYLEDM